MKGRKATLIKYVFLTSEILNDHQRNWAGAYYWHNKEYDERQYRRFSVGLKALSSYFMKVSRVVRSMTIMPERDMLKRYMA